MITSMSKYPLFNRSPVILDEDLPYCNLITSAKTLSPNKVALWDICEEIEAQAK